MAAVEEKVGQWLAPIPEDRRDARRKSALVGTPDQVVEQIRGLQDLGIDYLIAYFFDATWGDGMRVFGEHVINELST